MNRRLFLAAIAAAVWGFDPERALWVRGAKTISIPKPLVIPDARVMWAGFDDFFLDSMLPAIDAVIARHYQIPLNFSLRGGARSP